jgi:deazaflavin-dependent oxidoreductase (nitroreductase family)
MPLTGTYAPSTDDWARAQADTYETTAGAEAGDLRGMPIIVLTSVGAKSGNLRKNALMRVEFEGAYAVVASKGGAEKNPSWYFNLVANPHVELQDGAHRGDYIAHETTGTERDQWWKHAVAAYPDFETYTVGLDRTIPVFVLVPLPLD